MCVITYCDLCWRYIADLGIYKFLLFSLSYISVICQTWHLTIEFNVGIKMLPRMRLCNGYYMVISSAPSLLQSLKGHEYPICLNLKGAQNINGFFRLFFFFTNDITWFLFLWDLIQSNFVARIYIYYDDNKKRRKEKTEGKSSTQVIVF